ncbi:N-acetyltransferase [Streptomyces litmocidini]|uniref:GNAT family N-acetyltransferase n=1 Tax=Streptomyces litmocidini TaxID=67318 RepID=UPI00167E1CF2|nr:GNAT family N-acetyltransferase [Streptomyces litmocidini]GGU90492.1 N-acetyltransferase [Streptomyces litmocidini]
MDAQVTFRQADERDLDLLVGLFDGVARWMVRSGIEQWEPGARGPGHFRTRIAEGEVWIAVHGGRAVGAYELWWEDPEVWGPRPPVAGYVHRLMTDREAAPSGAGRALLAHAEARIAASGRTLARLDCEARDPRLGTYYEGAGYTDAAPRLEKVGADGRRYAVRLMEKALA